MSHECPAAGCAARVSGNQVACRRHWYRVTPETRRLVYAAYRAAPLSPEHQEAMHQAIAEMNGER